MPRFCGTSMIYCAEEPQVAVDVSAVQPIARDIVRQVARIFHQHLGKDLVTLVAHGSAVKGGFIGGSSDVDFVLFVAPGVLTAGDQLPFERALAVHRDLAAVALAPFRYVQSVVYPVGGRPGPGFIPATFQVVLGSADVPLATGDDLLAAANLALGQLDPTAIRDQVSNALLDHGEHRLSRQVRILSTRLGPVMYQVASLQLGDGLAAWQRTKPEIVEVLSSDSIIGKPLRQWMDTITRYHADGEPAPSALTALASGVAFMDAASNWYRARCAQGL